MIKLLGLFECEIEGKIGRFLLDHDTTINHAKEMTLAFLKHLGQLEDVAKAQQEAEKVQESPAPENVIPEQTVEQQG